MSRFGRTRRPRGESSRRPGRRWAGRLGRYRLADELGRGAFGTVWRAWDERSKTWVAVKVFSGRGGEEGAWRFLREQRLDIGHPSIIEVLDFASDSAGSYLVTELLPHGTLEDYVTERGPLAPDLVIRWGAHLLDAVAAIAAAGVVHRDIKPANVMLRDEPDGPRAVLVDFGQAWVDDGAELTSGLGPVGTSGYIAPELADPSTPPSPAGDVYAIGVTLRRALAGGGPTDATAGLAGLPATTPPELVALVDRLCARDPRQRPRADDAAAELRSLGQARTDAGLAPTGRAGLTPRVANPPDPHLRRKVGAGLAFAVAANSVALWAITRPDPPPAPEPARPAEIAWPRPSGPIAVADDGTIYSADVELGMVFRHEGAGLVAVAGGGDDPEGPAPAEEIDLSSALRLVGTSLEPTDTYTPATWTLAIGDDGAIWLNTGAVWRIDPSGEARRLLAVEPTAEVQTTPYQLSTLVRSEDAGEPSVFDQRFAIDALASPLMPRDGGVDVVDSTNDRILHVAKDGAVTTACDLQQTRSRGILPEGFSAEDAEGRTLAADERPLTPSSFTVLATDDCWVVDRPTGEVAHVVDGNVVGSFFGRPGTIGAEEPSDAAPGWTATPTALPFNSDDDLGRSKILGTTPSGTLLLHLTGTIVAGSLGELDADADLPGRVAWFEEDDSLTPDAPVPSDASARLTMSADGTRLAAFFELLDSSSAADPRLVVPSRSLALFDVDSLFDPNALLLPVAVTEADLRPPTYDVAAALSDRTIEGEELFPAAGDRTDRLRFAGIADTHMAFSGDRFVASLSSDPWLWQFSPRPADRLAFLSMVDEPPDGAEPCRVRDLAVAPSGTTAAMLCFGDGNSVITVSLDAGPDQEPQVLVSEDAFAAAAAAWGEANDVESSGLGPGVHLLYRPDDELLVATEDEGVVYRVDGTSEAVLEPLTGLVTDGPGATGRNDERLQSRLEGIEDDPVRVAGALRSWWTEIEGEPGDACAEETEQQSGFGWRDIVVVGSEDASQLVISTARCLIRIVPGEGTEPFAPEQPSARLTQLAGTPEALFAYDPVDATIWRYPSDGGDRELIAGRSGMAGVSPDGVRAAGSPIGSLWQVFVGPDGEPCFVEFEASNIRCVDERGALRTRAGLPVRRP